LVVDHVIQVSDLALLVGDDGEGQIGIGDLIDVRDPLLMRDEGVGAESNKFDAPLIEFRLEIGESTKLELTTYAR